MWENIYFGKKENELNNYGSVVGNNNFGNNN